MTSRRKSLLAAAFLFIALGASGCATVERFNPFKGKETKEIASEGERISIISADQKLEPAEALKGVDFSLPNPTVIAEWPVPGGTVEQSVENVDAAPNLSIVWRKSIGDGSKDGEHVTAPPVAAAGKVFTMDAAAVVTAHDMRTGAEVWRTNVRPSDNKRDREASGGGVAFAGGKLYVTSGFRVVAQLDAATGAVGWRTRTDQPIHGAPNVSGGRVYAVALDNTLLTFDATNGTPGWTYQALSESARILASSSPAISGDTVIASFGSGELVALKTSNGNDIWNEALSRASRTSALSEIRDIPGRPVIYQGDVFAVSHSGVFAATDLRSGQARWSLPVVGITSPWAAGDVVYVVGKDGVVVCAARESGQIYWTRDLNAGLKPKASRSGGRFSWMKMPGLPGKKALKPIWSSPLMANNRLIMVGSTGELVALNAKTGEVQRRMDIGSPALLGPIAAGDTIYVLTDTAQLIALR